MQHVFLSQKHWKIHRHICWFTKLLVERSVTRSFEKTKKENIGIDIFEPHVHPIYTHKKKSWHRVSFHCTLAKKQNATNTDWTHKAYVWSPEGRPNGDRWRWKSTRTAGARFSVLSPFSSPHVHRDRPKVLNICFLSPPSSVCQALVRNPCRCRRPRTCLPVS